LENIKKNNPTGCREERRIHKWLERRDKKKNPRLVEEKRRNNPTGWRVEY
jgi:hypothetical protein